MWADCTLWTHRVMLWVTTCGLCHHTAEQTEQWCVFQGSAYEGDSLCLSAAVAPLRPWLTGSVAICSGPRHSVQNCAVPIFLISFWIRRYVLSTSAANPLLICRPLHTIDQYCCEKHNTKDLSKSFQYLFTQCNELLFIALSIKTCVPSRGQDIKLNMLSWAPMCRFFYSKVI